MVDDVTGEPLERRPDDNVDALVKRLAAYHKQTAPLADYYAQKGLHKSVDASLESKAVFANVSAIFDSLRQKYSAPPKPKAPKFSSDVLLIMSSVSEVLKERGLV